MKKLLIFLLFMVICSPVFAIRVGKVDSDLENYMQVLYDSGELEEAVTDLTVSGLNGDDDETYEIFIRQVHGADDSNASVRFNGDYDTNYGTQEILSDGSAASASRSTSQEYFKSFADSSKELSVSLCHHIMNVSEDLSKTVITISTNGIDETGVDTVYSAGQVWNNTDEVTSMTFTSDVADGFGIGSRFIILRKVPDDDTGMKVGDLDIHGRVLGQWEIVVEEDITETISDLTISGLEGDSDVMYSLSLDLSCGNASGNYYRCLFNNDSDSNYGYQRLSGVDSTVGAERNTGNDYGIIYADSIDTNEQSLFDIIIYAKSGNERTVLTKSAEEISGTTISKMQIAGHTWNNKNDEITSIGINGTKANSIGVGSKIILWKLNLIEGDE